jgi:hypothetical protein
LQRDTITSFVLDDLPSVSTIPNNYLQFVCKDFTVLKYSHIILPTNATAASDNLLD